MWKYRILAPGSWGAYQRNDFSEPKLLHPPKHRKVLNSLTWDIWFSFINNNLLIFSTTYSLLQNSYITWFPPSPPRSSFLRVTWDAASWAWNPKNSRQIKHNSQRLGCAVLFVFFQSTALRYCSKEVREKLGYIGVFAEKKKNPKKVYLNIKRLLLITKTDQSS